MSRRMVLRAAQAVVIAQGAAVALIIAPVAHGAGCANEQFRAGPSSALPECRAYEIVSPLRVEPWFQTNSFGNSGQPENITEEQPSHIGMPNGAQTSVSGDKFVFFSTYAPPGSTTDGFHYLATRTATGWTAKGLNPPQSTDTGVACLQGYTVAYTPELTKGVLGDGWGQVTGHRCGHDEPLLVPGEPEGFQNLFVADFEAGTYQLVDPLPLIGSLSDAWFQSASLDLSHVVFNERAQLTPEAPVPTLTKEDLYEWVNGVVRLITILPNGEPVAGALANGNVPTEANGSPGGGADVFTHAVSADGSRVVFVAGGALYLRLNADHEQSPLDSEQHCTDPLKACTLQVDASEVGGEGGGGVFAWASTDGSKIFFRDDHALTANATPAPGEPDLYEFNLAASPGQRLTDVTTEEGGHANVVGVAGLSEDGSTIYFVASGILAENENSHGDTAAAAPGEPHLYVYRSGELAFIATLDEHEDSLAWKVPELLTARVSPNGDFIGFNSLAPLTGYVSIDANKGEADQQVFVYAATTGQLNCASCKTSGAAPTGPAGIFAPLGEVEFFFTPGYPLRNVTDTGKVFFGTSDALVPHDTNGLYDVYEYAGGAQHLISTGTSDAPSYFYGATPSGNDVYFITSQQLVPPDQDSAMSVYDARVGGGFSYAQLEQQCSGDACRGPLAPAPTTPNAGSISFTGPGIEHRSVPPTGAPVTARLRSFLAPRVVLSVTVASGGKITVAGLRTKTVRRAARAAGTYKVTVSLTRRALSMLRHRHRLGLVLHVRFVPIAGAASGTSISIKVKR